MFEVVNLTSYYARTADPSDKYGRLVSTTFFDSKTENDKLYNLRVAAANPINDSIDEYIMSEQNIPKNLQDIFRTSFKISTGSPLVQALVMARAAQLITLRYGEPDVLHEIAADLVLDTDTFVIPARHMPFRRQHRIAGRTQATWEFFMDVCKHPNDLDLLQPKDSIRGRELEGVAYLGTFNFVPFAITTFLLDRELVYMDTGRPNRPDQSGRFRSLIRECGLLGKQTGSIELNIVMKEVAAVLGTMVTANEADVPDFWLFKDINPCFEKLKNVWEDRHQQTFIAEC